MDVLNILKNSILATNFYNMAITKIIKSFIKLKKKPTND